MSSVSSLYQFYLFQLWTFPLGETEDEFEDLDIPYVQFNPLFRLCFMCPTGSWVRSHCMQLSIEDRTYPDIPWSIITILPLSSDSVAIFTSTPQSQTLIKLKYPLSIFHLCFVSFLAPLFLGSDVLCVFSCEVRKQLSGVGSLCLLYGTWHSIWFSGFYTSIYTHGGILYLTKLFISLFFETRVSCSSGWLWIYSVIKDNHELLIFLSPSPEW